MYRHLLVPIDDTPLADRVVDQAVGLAAETGARITFLHVAPDFGSTTDGAVLHAVAPRLYARHSSGRAPLVLGRAESVAHAAGVKSSAVTALGSRPHETILELARERGCDLIFMATHGRRGLRNIWLGSVTQRVLQQADRPVLVAAVEVNQPMSAEQRAVAIIRAEHRSLAAVVEALQHAWRAGIDAPRPPDLRLARAMVYYLQEFAERLHRPKEEQYLFRKVAERTRECDELIAEMQSQHVEGARRSNALRGLLDEIEAGDSPERRLAFQAALDRLLEEQRRHWSCEERLILPVAGRWLEPGDWEEIVAAFSANGDPQFGVDQDEAFDRLCARLLRVAAAGGERPSTGVDSQ